MLIQKQIVAFGQILLNNYTRYEIGLMSQYFMSDMTNNSFVTNPKIEPILLQMYLQKRHKKHLSTILNICSKKHVIWWLWNMKLAWDSDEFR